MLALTGKPSDVVRVITSGTAALRSTGATPFGPWHFSYLASACAEIGQYDDAWRCVGEATTAVETTKEKWREAEVNRIAGEIVLKSPKPDNGKPQAYFQHALRRRHRHRPA
jgi:hypothetical protein